MSQPKLEQVLQCTQRSKIKLWGESCCTGVKFKLTVSAEQQKGGFIIPFGQHQLFSNTFCWNIVIREDTSVLRWEWGWHALRWFIFRWSHPEPLCSQQRTEGALLWIPSPKILERKEDNLSHINMENVKEWPQTTNKEDVRKNTRSVAGRWEIISQG